MKERYHNDQLELDIKGLNLARAYYEEIGRPMLMSRFPEYMDKIAAGAVGEGSDCFGYDDQISMDHDYGPAFTIWLPEEVYQEIGPAMQEAYQSLPSEFMGISAGISRQQAADRKGVVSIERFYRKYLGRNGVPKDPMSWLSLPDHYLATATNGQVFEDNPGQFTEIRNQLLAYYPEDIRKKKIAACLVRMAHAGQVNYARVMRRYDVAAARFALTEFTRSAISLIYLLNRSYCPYYKWMWRGLSRFPDYYKESELIARLSESGLALSAWRGESWNSFEEKLNLNDSNVRLIEELCGLMAARLKDLGLTDSDADYLEVSAYQVQAKIEDPRIKMLHILVG